MSTRADITLINRDGTGKMIYFGHDGYPTGDFGLDLLKYNTPQKVNSLMNKTELEDEELGGEPNPDKYTKISAKEISKSEKHKNDSLTQKDFNNFGKNVGELNDPMNDYSYIYDTRKPNPKWTVRYDTPMKNGKFKLSTHDLAKTDIKGLKSELKYDANNDKKMSNLKSIATNNGYLNDKKHTHKSPMELYRIGEHITEPINSFGSDNLVDKLLKNKEKDINYNDIIKSANDYGKSNIDVENSEFKDLKNIEKYEHSLKHNQQYSHSFNQRSISNSDTYRNRSTKPLPHKSFGSNNVPNMKQQSLFRNLGGMTR